MTDAGETARTQDPEGTRVEESLDENSTCVRRLPRGMTLSTYNVRTLYQTGKFDQLVRKAKEIENIDIVGIQEHRWITQDNISQQWSDDRDFLFIYSTASSERVGGVGVLVRKKHVPAIRSMENISSRILVVHFEGNPRTSIVVVYAPTEMATADEKDLFYKDLSDTIINIPPHRLVVVLGDFNARIGMNSLKQYPQVIERHLYHEKSNNNGNRLVELCSQTQMREAQSIFPQPKKDSGPGNIQTVHLLN